MQQGAMRRSKFRRRNDKALTSAKKIPSAMEWSGALKLLGLQLFFAEQIFALLASELLI
jgi:hypothetical protein